MLEIRKLKKEDREASFRLSQYSFGFWSDDPPSAEMLDTVNLDDTIGGFVDGQLVSKVTVRPYQQTVRGVMKPMGGVAGVATDPLHRGKGYIRRLLNQSFEKMRQDGQVIASLYPFLETFYEKFGYVTTNDYLWLKFPTRNLAHYLPETDHSDEWEIVKLSARDGQDAYWAFLEDVAPSYHGFAVSAEVPDWIWRNFMAKNQHLLLLKQNGRSVGLLRYKISGNMHGGEMTLNSIFWKSMAARNRLFGYIAMHEVNLPTTAMAVPMGVNFQTWFKNPTQNYSATIDYVAMMSRVVDPVGAVAGLPASVNGRFTFNYQDPQCPWMDGVYEMVGENGRLRLQPSDSATLNELDPKGLSALVFGSLTAEEIIYRDWGVIDDQADINLLINWFPPEFTFNTNKF